MCGIAGVVDLAGRRAADPLRGYPADMLAAMAAALYHRGPDEDGFLRQDGVALANRRLSIVGLGDGRQPISNEDQTVWVVFNGELFDYPEQKAALEAKGHHFRTHTDTELLPHLWEEYGDGMFDHVRGQFAFCLWDTRQNVLVLARDRVGICPLFYTVRRDGDGWQLLFASEIKGLFASGVVPARPDRRGLNHVFTFFAAPGPVTCFDGIRLLLPGQYVRLRLGPDTRPEDVKPRFYWQIDFPDRGHEEDGDAKQIVDRFESVLMTAVEKRLRADVPVVSYLSGGVDSSQVVVMASKALGRAIPTFTIAVQEERFNEEAAARQVARQVGSESVVVPFGGPDILAVYPELIRTAEVPVIDTACAALMELAKSVHAHGFKVALTGEGSDEFLAGYPWFKLHRVLSAFDVIPGLSLSQRVRRGVLRLAGLPRFPWAIGKRNAAAVGGYNAWLDVYGMMSLARLMFYSDEMRAAVGDHVPYEDLELDTARMARWHPLNRALAVGARVMLAGMLLSSKGDRVAMHSSVETRYPFLDEDVIAFLARLHPRWKLHRLTDKYVLRLLAQRWLPKEIAWRKKAMFRAPMDAFHLDNAPPFIDQLLSDESLRRTGYFDPAAVRHWRDKVTTMRPGSATRTAVEMGLVGVTATQLWHQVFIDSTLADLDARRVGRTSGASEAHR
ncbi:MAG TPA: asparagine synthase (glutamine-hydrolyzing), partial [Gemmataceae bacterium]